MNKKLILIGLMLTTFVSSAFAQMMSFSESAKSRATAGEFTSDSDNVSAKDIFDIEKMFFSAGYLPALNGAGAYAGDASDNYTGTLGNGGSWDTSSMGTVSAFWAMPINDMITVGLAGEYQMLAKKTETADDSTSVANAFDTTQNFGEYSAFNLRPVFKYGDFAFHYRISRGLGGSVKTIDTTLAITSGDELYKSTTVDDDAVVWQHEIGLAYNASAFKVYLPVGVEIVSDKKTTGTTNHLGQSYDDDDYWNSEYSYSTTYTGTEADYATLYISPEVVIPFEMGPMYQITVGLDMSFQLYKNNQSTSTNHYVDDTTGADSGSVTRVMYEDQAYNSFDLYVNPSFAWSLAGGKVDVAIDPTIGLNYAYSNSGRYATYTKTTLGSGNASYTGSSIDSTEYDNFVTPYLNVVVGTLARPVEWFELRAGVEYGLNWYNQITTKSYVPDINMDGNYTTSNYTFASAFNVYGGFGFIIGEHFFIDAYLQMGQDTTLAFDNEDQVDTSSSFIENLAYGVQLSYRF